MDHMISPSKSKVGKLQKLIKQAKTIVAEAREKTETAQVLLDTLEREFEAIKVDNQSSQQKTRKPKILTYDTATVNQKVRIVNSPYGIATIKKKGSFFATCQRETSGELLRRSYGKLKTLSEEEQAVVDRHNQ